MCNYSLRYIGDHIIQEKRELTFLRRSVKLAIKPKKIAGAVTGAAVGYDPSPTIDAVRSLAKRKVQMRSRNNPASNTKMKILKTGIKDAGIEGVANAGIKAADIGLTGGAGILATSAVRSGLNIGDRINKRIKNDVKNKVINPDTNPIKHKLFSAMKNPL